jgi:MFS family permease
MPPRGWLRNAARWAVALDQDGPLRSEAEVAAEVERNYRWNYAVNLLDGANFWFGISFISSRTILPLFVTKLSPNPFLIGLLAIIGEGAWYLPQILTANLAERLPRQKPMVVRLGFFLERLPLWLLLGAALVSQESPGLALALFFVFYAWFNLGAGLVATSWQDLIARCFPVERRGRFFGTTNFVGAAVGALGAGVTAWLLQTFSFPTSFLLTFVMAAVAITLSWFFLSLTREPALQVTRPRQSQRRFLTGLPRVLRRDRNYRHFLLARALQTLGAMGAGFVTVAAVQRWQVSDSTVGGYTAAMLLGQMGGYLGFGFLADRAGHKLPLELGTLAATLAFCAAWLAPSPDWTYVIFALLGVSSSAIIGSGLLVALEFSSPQRRPTYVGLTNSMVGLITVVAPLLGAWLASVSYGLLFSLSAAISLGALTALHWWVQEPRWAGASSVSDRCT